MIRAEAEYAAGRVEAAYRALQAALSAQSLNLRARDDLALIALKSGRAEVALEAASTVIASDVAPEVKARAWFNLGLACQQAGRPLSYNDKRYCNTSIVDPFLQAWQLHASAIGKNKLKELFETDAINNCTVTGSKSATQKYHFASHDSAANGASVQTLRIYVYHRSSQTIDPSKVHWQASQTDPQDRTRTQRVSTSPSLLQRHELGEFAITVLESDRPVQPPVSIGQHQFSNSAVLQ